ncbi:HXXXD-type acyl-transferase family protein [Forsythia ovata]|uniref:HXXXD-type acyl-transferase family protein n=1 Tax=Forsythia ovata TaxID=205694 RepID=A0ABD1R490_9LAMI
MPLVYFYPADGKISNWERSNHLKKSLPQALTRFYPLAGRIVDNLYVDCNDEGVEFFQAKAEVELSEILSNPIPGELNKFLPYDLNDSRDYCMSVQVSFHELWWNGCRFSHFSQDCRFHVPSLVCKQLGRHCSVGILIFHTQSLRLPLFSQPKDHVPDSNLVIKEEIVTKIFVFSTSKIDALKDKFANTYGEKQRPTRTEALSTFIWSRFMASTSSRRQSQQDLLDRTGSKPPSKA